MTGHLFWIYVLSTFGGMVIVTVPIVLMHKTLGKVGTDDDKIGNRRPWFRPADIYVGFTERAIATTLYIFAPTALALFIGGWVAAKIAGSWTHRQKQHYIQAQKLFLVGNALSFGLAIWAGHLYRPESIAAFRPTVEAAPSPTQTAVTPP
jgi:hypothetical protein